MIENSKEKKRKIGDEKRANSLLELLNIRRCMYVYMYYHQWIYKGQSGEMSSSTPVQPHTKKENDGVAQNHPFPLELLYLKRSHSELLLSELRAEPIEESIQQCGLLCSRRWPSGLLVPSQTDALYYFVSLRYKCIHFCSQLDNVLKAKKSYTSLWTGIFFSSSSSSHFAFNVNRKWQRKGIRKSLFYVWLEDFFFLLLLKGANISDTHGASWERAIIRELLDWCR